MKMEESTMKNEVVKVMTDIEYYPSFLEEKVDIEKYMKVPVTEVSALGVAFEPLISAFQNIKNIGGDGVTSGLCRITIPKGGHLAKFTKEPNYLGTVLDKQNMIAGQARLNPLVCNPTMLFMAVALMGIDKSLDAIQETQQEMLEFLEQKEKSKLRGNLNILMDVQSNYKYNWENEKYKTNKHILVQEIKRDGEQSIIFYRELIDEKINKQSFIHSDQDVKSKLSKIQSEFKEYQLALYLYSFASFLEVMLLENFEPAYLDSVAHKIEEYSFNYRELYTKCYEQIEKYSKSSIHSHVLGGLASINRVAGDAVGKVPGVSKSRIDETLIKASNRLGKFSSRMTEKTMEQFSNNQGGCVLPFIANINAINRLYNQPMELIFDQENLYLSLPER